MSGFVGILNLDGAPVDRSLLEGMTRFLAFRGPDGQEILCLGSVGLGHALLRATRESATEKQPGKIDDRLYIVADARIDARAELIEKLKNKSSIAGSLSLSTPDSELILLAYDSWGEGCVEHLIGDFSFAIWDIRRNRLLCARDHFGVKPFFYAHVGSCLIFSNTLNCIRIHPAVSGVLNDLAIADFLLFDSNQEPGTTAFAEIRRLPPAHTLKIENETLVERRYWELAVTTPVRYPRDKEYLDRFRELLDAAVADRLRGDSAAVTLSGGLDSTTVAASARRAFAGNGKSTRLYAFTEVFDRLIPHEERHYATLSAEALDIPIEYFVNDHWKIFDGADKPEFRSPEPIHNAWPVRTRDFLRQISARSRTALTGYGADPALLGRITVHFRQLLKAGHLGRALLDAGRYLSAEGRLSRLYIKRRWRLLFRSRREAAEGYPPWLSKDFEREWKLQDRWSLVNNRRFPVTGVRPEAMRVMVDWVDLFESFDSGATGVPVEVCHAFYDLRLVNFLLALPRLPWCCDKELLREAARGVLPDLVRLRGKSPLAVEPLVALLQDPESAWVDRFEPLPELERFVVRNRIPNVHGELDSVAGWLHLKPLSLNFWLQGCRR